ncbi:unnamed protein product [Auanema sp. JU1783]|nr:unnamed protein product [Auanema sp. JU1783]
MSREDSTSPSEIRIHIPTIDEASQYSVPINEDTITHPILSFSDPLTSSVIPIESNDDRSIDKEANGDKKKLRKSIDEPKGRRRDTATSITNFIHRFTRFEKEEKTKIARTEEEKHVERPDKLTFPNSEDNDWYPMKDFVSDVFRTALDMGNEQGMPLYEWKVDTLDESIVPETPSGNDLIRLQQADYEHDSIEQSLTSMLEEFRSGKMKSFTDEQLSDMRRAKKQHEEITNLHLVLCAKDLDVSNINFKHYDELSDKLYKMHSRLTDLSGGVSSNSSF